MSVHLRIARSRQGTEEKTTAISTKWQATSLTFLNYNSLGPVMLDLEKTRQLMDWLEESAVRHEPPPPPHDGDIYIYIYI